jgi:hypothetical protein
MKKETQNVRVAKRLVKCGSITTSYASSSAMYISRLASRINDLVNICNESIYSELIKWGNSRQAKYTVDEAGRKELAYLLEDDLI